MKFSEQNKRRNIYSSFKKQIFNSLLSNLLRFIKKFKTTLNKFFNSDSKIIYIGVILSIFLVLGVRFLGIIEIYELKVLDSYFRWRAPEAVDERIVIVKITESDLLKFNQYPISDYELYQLLSKIQEQNPRLIGLDIYRDKWVNPEYLQGKDKLTNFLDDEANSNVIGIEKIIGDPQNPVMLPHPILEAYGQVGSNDISVDRDAIVRRNILLPDPIRRNDLLSFNLLLAAEYLKEEGITLKENPQGKLQFGNTVLEPLAPYSGGYNNKHGGYQIMLNYRSKPDSFESFKAFDVIFEEIPDDAFKDKIVIICTDTQSFPDAFYLPFSDDSSGNALEYYGGLLQANATSQIVSAVLDDRPLIKSLSNHRESWLILGFVCLTTYLITLNKNRNWVLLIYSSIVSITLSVLVFGTGFLMFVRDAWWLPIFPTILGIGIAAIVTTIAIYFSELQKSNDQLRSTNKKLEQKQLEIEEYNRTLEEQIEVGVQKLERARKRIEADLRLRQLGESVVGINHQIGNPLIILRGNINPALKSLEDLLSEIDNLETVLAEEDTDLLYEHTNNIKNNVEVIKEQEKRIKEIMVMMMDGINPNQKPQSKPTNINQLLIFTAKSIFSAKRLEGYPSFSYEIDTDDKIEDIDIVSIEIAQVIGNLIDNACHAVFTKQELLNEDYQPLIRVCSRLEDSNITISIKDNGTGIPNKLQENEGLFAAFSTGKTSGLGTGLGLAIAKTLVEKNSGTISYSSEPGQYTEFIIKLPYSPNI